VPVADCPHLSIARRETPLVRWTVILVALTYLSFFLVVPLVAVFTEAFKQGAAAYFKAFEDAETWHAIRLTLFATGMAVALNTAFGLTAAWLLGKFDFRGRNLLTSLIDLPFAVSPVISGLVFVLLFGAQGWFGPWLGDHDIRLIFATPGIVLATTFVTFPFVARELTPVMLAKGRDQEEAARMLGASGWQTFWKVTVPSVKWGLLYGVILCSARAMGEFGAVSVVSGHIRGETNTLPLHIEALYNEYQFVAAFACASALSLLALVTLALKAFAERRRDQSLKQETAP
jgi:sulfate transport system permease protein